MRKGSIVVSNIRLDFIPLGMHGIQQANITDDEWEYIANNLYATKGRYYKERTDVQILRAKQVAGGTGLFDVAQIHECTPKMVRSAVTRCIRTLNKHIAKTPEYKTNQLLES